MSYEYQYPLIASSSLKAGAVNKSADGSAFTVNFENPLFIPPEANNVTLEVQESTIVWTMVNIFEDVNDHFYLIKDTVPYDIQVPQGLYDVSSLQAAIDRELVSQGLDSGLIVFLPDTATQKVVLQLSIAGLQVDFAPTNTMREILGFDAQLVPAGSATTGQYREIAPNVARFNTIQYFLVHSDLISGGIPVNNIYSSVIAQVGIDVAPGSTIVSQPYNPVRIPADNLKGAKRSNVRFWITNQDDEVVNTNGEDWSIRIVIRYNI